MVSAADGSRTVKTEDKQIIEAEQRQREREEREAAEARKEQARSSSLLCQARLASTIVRFLAQRRSSYPSRGDFPQGPTPPACIPLRGVRAA